MKRHAIKLIRISAIDHVTASVRYANISAIVERILPRTSNCFRCIPISLKAIPVPRVVNAMRDCEHIHSPSCLSNALSPVSSRKLPSAWRCVRSSITDVNNRAAIRSKRPRPNSVAHRPHCFGPFASLLRGIANFVHPHCRLLCCSHNPTAARARQ